MHLSTIYPTPPLGLSYTRGFQFTAISRIDTHNNARIDTHPHNQWFLLLLLFFFIVVVVLVARNVFAVATAIVVNRKYRNHFALWGR